MRSLTQTKSTPKPSFTPVQTGLLQRKCACGNSASLTGKCTECENKRLTLQRRSANQDEVSQVPPIVHEVLRETGQPLDRDALTFMESRFAHDFSKVRVHTDAKAAESVQAVQALAYTVGRDIVFGAGQYAPQTREGQRLLAHELTHVIQQGSSQKYSVEPKTGITRLGNGGYRVERDRHPNIDGKSENLEKQANEVAESVVNPTIHQTKLLANSANALTTNPIQRKSLTQKELKNSEEELKKARRRKGILRSWLSGVVVRRKNLKPTALRIRWAEWVLLLLEAGELELPTEKSELVKAQLKRLVSMQFSDEIEIVGDLPASSEEKMDAQPSVSASFEEEMATPPEIEKADSITTCSHQDFTNRDSKCAWHKIIPHSVGDRIKVEQESQPASKGKAQSAAKLSKPEQLGLLSFEPVYRDKLRSLLFSVDETLNQTPIPRASGELKVSTPGQIQFQSKSNIGNGEPKTDVEAKNLDFIKFIDDIKKLPTNEALKKLLGRAPMPIETQIWPRVFKEFIFGEGDTAAINAISREGQVPVLTLGTGLTTRPKRDSTGFSIENSLKVLRSSQIPPEYHHELYKAGMLVTDDGIEVLDTERGIVETTPRNAILLIAADQRRLSVFINLAQSTDLGTVGGQPVEFRVAVWRAQFLRAVEINAGFLPDFNKWTDPRLFFATKLIWGNPGTVNWSKFAPTLSLGEEEGIREIARIANTNGLSWKDLCDTSIRTGGLSKKHQKEKKANRILKSDGHCLK